MQNFKFRKDPVLNKLNLYSTTQKKKLPFPDYKIFFLQVKFPPKGRLSKSLSISKRTNESKLNFKLEKHLKIRATLWVKHYPYSHSHYTHNVISTSI